VDPRAGMDAVVKRKIPSRGWVLYVARMERKGTHASWETRVEVYWVVTP